MNIEKIKSQFPILKQKNRGKPLVYFDNAATSLKPLSVIDSESDFYKNYYGSVHRSVYELGEKATNAFEGTRNKVAEFIGIKDSSSIIFTKGATEAINLVADAWGHTNLNEGDVVLLTEMEHHSNIVPWQIITKRTGATLDYITVQPDGSLDMNSLKSKLTSKVKMLSLTHASNVLGTINPIKEIINLAHENNTLVMVDGCQSAPHFKINVEELGCDFFAFSGHKMLGPTGVGVLYSKKDLLAIHKIASAEDWTKHDSAEYLTANSNLITKLGGSIKAIKKAKSHYLAKGGNLNRMIAEIYGKQSGCCGGKGGSMHLIDKSCGFMLSLPIVGSIIPISVGASFAFKLRKEKKNRKKPKN